MTHRDWRARIGNRTSEQRSTSKRNLIGRLRDKRRRKDRRLLSESLEQRQLLAGPDVIGIQPNEGQLLNQGTVLNVSPRELVFRFDDNSEIDPSTLSAIRITRAGEDGVFESATATSDLNTSGQVLLEFRAVQSGSLGNGIELQFTSSNRTGSSLPILSVNERTISVDFNSNPIQPSRVQDLVSAFANDPIVSGLVEVVPVSGASLTNIGGSIPDTGLNLTLLGANSAEAVTDFGTGGDVLVRLVSQLPGVDGRGTQVIIERTNFGGAANPVVLISNSTIRVQLNSTPGFETTADDFITAINTNPEASGLILAALQQGDVNTNIGGVTTSIAPLTLSGVSDVLVEPGFIGLGDSPREVVFRFAEPLPDDLYQIDILGTGSFALRNVDGEQFRDGTDLTRQFSINLGPKILAVVPEPIRRSTNGQLSPDVGKIEVHFNEDDLNPSLATTASFYQLIFTGDTARNTDDVIVTPTSVQYNNITNIATLDFGRPLSRFPAGGGQFLTGAARLRIGTNEGLPAPPTEVSLSIDPTSPNEPGDTFDTAFDLNSQWTVSANRTTSARLGSEIFNTAPFELNLPGSDVPGTRNIRPDDPSRLTRTVPLDHLRAGADTVDGISVIQYNFTPSWKGDDPSRPGINLEEITYFNQISEQQKQRVREVMQLYSEYLGINFVEVEGEATSQAFFSIAVGDLYGGDVRAVSGDGGIAVVTRDRNLDGVNDLGVLDLQDFDESTDDQFGGEFFRGAMFVVGQLLGYGYADDLPQPVTQSTSFIFSPGSDNEPAYPSVADIVHGQYLYRPDSTDIDLYRFSLDTPGTLSVETLAERLGSPSLLDTTLRLYREGVGGSFEEIAQNDDYFSNDSLIELEVEAGTYVVGVSARGNDNYDPAIASSGFGGLSEGEYELALDFRPSQTSAILDSTGVALDGDGDNRPGGVFDFWFVPNDSNNTLYVDKASPGTGTGLGTIGNPYNEIDQAINVAQPGQTIRVIGNGGVDGRVETAEDNFSYQIGFASNGNPLQDGSTLNLPQGVRMIIDSGAVLKLSGARIGIGSVSPLIDVSDAALQVLGTPTIITSTGLPARDATNTVIPGSVIFTSLQDTTVGMGNSSTVPLAPRPGDWGGIDFRGDLDSADESRRNRELEGVFLNHIQYADMRYGGGAVSIGGRQVVVSPIDMAITRASVINSRITNSADAAMAATPDTFTETRFTDPFYQADGSFTPDFTRIGPSITGNTVIDNSINGLFIRVVTRTGDVLEKVTQSARFDDTDIPHVLTENLVISGTAGGPIFQSSAPSSLLVRTAPTATGNVPAGTYVYRITNVNASGLESASSQPTVSVTLTETGGVQLNQLPTTGAGNNFVSRKLYRAIVDDAGNPGLFRLVKQLNASDTSTTDSAAVGTTILSTETGVLRSRLDARLAIDPGTVLKIDGARIESRFGANLIAEGLPSLPIVFTSLEDQRYGGGGTFDTNDRGDSGELNPGDWGGLYIGAASSASIDHAVITGGGGETRIEGGFASFNAIEVHQGSLRLANSRLEQNADGRGIPSGDRVGRGENTAGTVFVRAATPVIINTDFISGESAALSFDVNSLSNIEVSDAGRATGLIDAIDVEGNAGPLLQGNRLSDNSVNGMIVRGGELATAGVWDDVDIVHVVTDSIEIPNQHIYGGLKLQSDARGSLVVKFLSAENETAGIVVGGNLATASDEFVDIADRIGGSLQVIGHPDFPVVLTTLADDTAGAGFTLEGRAQVDTNNDGITGVDLADQEARLPAGPEVNNGTLIDNDVDPNTPGFFNFRPLAGGELGTARTTVQGLTQIFPQQNPLFDFGHFIDVGADGGAVGLGTTTVTQQPTLIADDRVVSAGTFAGDNGIVNWQVEQYFNDGGVDLISEITLTSSSPLGDIRFINYYDPIIGTDAGDILFTEGTPGTDDFRLTILDGPEEIGFRQYGTFEPGPGLVSATYEGWIADDFPDLITAPEFNLPFVIGGTVDGTSVPTLNDPRFVFPNYGPGILTSALAWQVNPLATSATITTNLQVIADVFGTQPNAVEAGLWDGIVIREAADDRNVSAIAEEEPVRSAFIDVNAIPSQSQFLGEIAPNEQSGDENRRLGFVVDGAITRRDDLDVYSFVAQSNTEVWLDIDRTGNQLDSVIELIDANGNILAASNDSLLAETNLNALYVRSGVNPDAARPLSVVSEQLESQQITISESIVDATGGGLTLRIEGSDTDVLVPVDAFNLDPAGAIRVALESTYPELGPITASLLRRVPRQVDIVNPSTLLRAGDDFDIQLSFDPNLFIGRSVPTISVAGVTVTGATVSASVTPILLGSQVQDTFSINPKDAGMRIRLPGEAGTRNLYHVRVRSSNTTLQLDPDGQYPDALTNNNLVRNGLSKGGYQLQIRLSEVDEHAGTQMRLSDVRYAVNGLQIIGQPLHSPLLGEEYEIPGDNDSLATAQPLGYYGATTDAIVDDNGTPIFEAGPLQSDRLAKSFAGALDSATDVDWYRFEINYENLTRDSAALYLSTVFDLDYSGGFARPDMALYVFNAAGQVVLVGGDSNVANDLPGVATSNNTDDISRGSASADDPYIGAAELSEGTYYVAVANQQNVPLPLDQFFNAASLNPLLRLEPIDSVRRIAEDRLNLVPTLPLGTADAPVVPLLFDDNSIVDYTLDDVLLYINTGSSLVMVNPFTGVNYGTVGNFSNDEIINEVAFRSNGELFAYNEPTGVRTDGSLLYYRIDTGSAALSAPLSSGAAVTTYGALITTVDGEPDLFVPTIDNSGLDVEGISISSFGGVERGFFVANRQFLNGQAIAAGARYSDNILYRFDPEDGRADGPNVTFLSAFFGGALSGAGTSPREVGRIDTGIAGGAGSISSVLGLTAPTEVNAQGIEVPSLVDGNRFTLTDTIGDGARSVTFEFDSGITLTGIAGIPVIDGQTVTIDGTVFEFNTGQRVSLSTIPGSAVTEGSQLTVEGIDGETATFEFVRTGQAAVDNIAIPTLDGNGQPLTSDQLAFLLATAINQSISNVSASSFAGDVVFGGPVVPTLIVGTGATGITVRGDGVSRAGNIRVDVSESISSTQLIDRLANAIRGQGISVANAGTQLALPTASEVIVDATGSLLSPLTVSGAPGVDDGNVAIPILPGDSAADVAQRVVDAVKEAVDANNLVSEVPNGRSVTFNQPANITDILPVQEPGQPAVINGLTRAGLQLGGTITGVEVVESLGALFAVSDTGGLYRVDQGLLSNAPDPSIATQVFTATDLIGENFTALRAGPVSFNGGELRQTLFGLTSDGRILAFNQFGELQPVFFGGRSILDTGIGNAQGLDFSTLGFNLWHTTNQRGADAGHGIDALDNGTRVRVNGGSSLAFNYEANAFNTQYPAGEAPVRLNNDGTVANPRQDGTNVEDTYNLPGGAKGVVQSNAFSLEGYAASDEPTLYFNYFLETDEFDSISNDRDSLRVYVIKADGSQHLVATNNTARGAFPFDDEFDDPIAFGQYDDNLDIRVQQLFDNTDSWRQARVPLSDFAGETELSLRIEFATAGTTATGSLSLRTTSGETLIDGQNFTVGGETFSIDLAPAVGVPSGAEIAALYADPDALAIVTIAGQDYVLNDGDGVDGSDRPNTRNVDLTTQISVSLLEGTVSTTTLASLSAAQIAQRLTEAIQFAPPPNALVPDLVFADAQDTLPSIVGGRNDVIFSAFSLPYTGGNVTFEGTGQLGNDRNNGSFEGVPLEALDPVNVDDVDLISAVVEAGTTIQVDIEDAGISTVDTIIRFFDAAGNPLAAQVSVPNSASVVAPETGTIYIGISGNPNNAYNAQTGANRTGGSVGQYLASISINPVAGDLRVQASGNTIELAGSSSVTASPAGLFNVTGQNDVLGIPVSISRFMSSEQVAIVVRQVLADRFTDGNLDLLPSTGSSILATGLNIEDPGPFANESQRWADRFSADQFNGNFNLTSGAVNNNFEGVYLDDFIIGFAERGEIATGSNVVDTAFVTDQRPNFPVPEDPVSNLVTGSYQVEIRDAAEYVNSAVDLVDGTTAPFPFRTFDTNDRLDDSRTITALSASEIRDGSTFSIFDGRSTVTFEFDQIEADNGVTPGRVQVPYSLQMIVPGSERVNQSTGLPIPGTGTIRSQTAAEVAATIVDAINRTDVQAVIDLPAQLESGVDGTTNPTINLFGDVVVESESGALAAVEHSVRRGDDNRDRSGQGVILIENSRFLFNEGHGIVIAHDLTATVAGTESPSIVRYPRNLVELNTESIKPGVVIQSNILAFNGIGQLQIDGIGLGLGDTQSDPVPFDRIVNNTIIGGTIFAGLQSPPQTFQGVLFPQGNISFADVVVDYLPSAGGNPPTPIHQDPDRALGIPDAGGRGPEPTDGLTTVSLGLGGSLTLQFENNLLSGSGDSNPDLIIFETGAIESVNVEISRDGVLFESIGLVGGVTNTIDIDAFGFGTQDRFAFVRLTDARQGADNVASLGADIDAVGALSSVPVESFTAGGVGIDLVNNAAPVLLNNIIANAETGLQVETANDNVVLGGNTFYRNTADAPDGISLGRFPQQISDAEVLFVGASELVFAPASGAPIIDSSIDSLEDRPSLTTIKNPLGLPPSPILAPRLDVNGQLRIDDPNVETPSGLGERVFKDRGASDRGDLVGPRVVLLSPQAANLGETSGVVSVFGQSPQFFEVQLIDGLAPADVTPGTGIDDRSVSSGSVLLLEDNVALVEGIDYRYGYNPSTNVIRLTPIAGVWKPDSTYVIRMIDASDAIVAASDGSTYRDGEILNVTDNLGVPHRFEYELGITMTIPAGGVAGGTIDDTVFEIFDGISTVTFELDADFNNNGVNQTVTVGAAATAAEVASAIAAAINDDTTLNLSAYANDLNVQLLGPNPLTTIAVQNNAFPTRGQIGTEIGFGIQIPVEGAAVADTFEDGQTFSIRRGATTVVTFEFDTDGNLDTPDATAIAISEFATLDQVADEIVRVVGGAGLGLSPVNVGFGRVFLGGDSNYSVDLAGSVLTQLGLPGQIATVPIVVQIDQPATEVALNIAAVIDGAGIAGVTTSVVDTQIFLEGTRGVNGVGGVETVTISDEVGNLLQSNQANGRTELTIFVGGGFDYGDAPFPYASSSGDGGPRHAVDSTFTLGSIISADSDAKLPNADDDDGITLSGVRAGFNATGTITVNNTNGRSFFVDAWFDWNGNGLFESSERRQFPSTAFAGGSAINFTVPIPSDAQIGEAYARFRLSEQSNLSPTEVATSGEVEDYRMVITNNPFQNPSTSRDENNLRRQYDVNASGIVTPLDALQIINVLGRDPDANIQLDVLPLPTNLPTYPDVNGDGRITVGDALQVINELARTSFSTGGTGEFVPVADGVLASGATVIGDALISDANQTHTSTDEDSFAELESSPATTLPAETSPAKTSVFDIAPVVQVDSVIDSLAQDAREDTGDDDHDTLDRLFASF